MIKFIMTIILSMGLVSCATTPVQFYVLEPISPSSTTSENSQHYSIGIGPVSIPVLLEQKKIVTRSSNNTVQISEFHQWGSPLQDSFVQALTHNLTTLRPSNIVRAYPWSVHGTVDRQIIIDLTRFDTTPGKSADLVANWTIKNENNHEVLKNGRSVITHALMDSTYPGSVHALSKLIDQFSQELVMALSAIAPNK